MSEPVSICARNVSKHFRHGSSETLFRLLRRLVFGGVSETRAFHALSEVNLDVRKGEVVGIVGNNGAGKTTLLKTLAGIYQPTTGEIRIQGEVAFFAGLGVGMVGDLAVRDNVFLYGAVCGLRRARIEEVFDEVIAWAELGEFVESPLRTLSAGMRSRCAFSIARHVEAEILFLDEAFTAGDSHFRDKCNRFFAQRRRGPQTILAATHSLDFVHSFCDKALWMDRGRQRAFGPVDEVIEQYQAANAKL
jgi:lipopolysaccharide transport system ATP-binding protein